MAYRDVIKFRDDLYAQLQEMEENINELAELSRTGMVSPETFENAKVYTDRIKDNYEKVSWVLFLLNKPKRKNKESRYTNQSKKLLRECGNWNSDTIRKQNNDLINQCKEEIHHG